MTAELDQLYPDALKMARDKGSVSANELMRCFRIGYGHAAALLEQMTADGVIAGEAESEGTLRNPVMERRSVIGGAAN